MSKGRLSARDLLLIEQAKARLHMLDAEFKWYHVEVIDVLDDNNEIEREGDVLEELEDKMAYIIVSLKSISSAPTTSSGNTTTIKTERKELEVLRLRFADFEINVKRINSKITTVTPGPSIDRCLLEQCNRQIIGFETEMLDISRKIADMVDTGELNDEKFRISDVIFNLGLKINKFLSTPKDTPNKPVTEGIRLLKIAVPTFDGDPFKWINFWNSLRYQFTARSS